MAATDARRLTGLGPKELLLQRDTQGFVRIDQSGTRVEYIRVPLALLREEPAE